MRTPALAAAAAVLVLGIAGCSGIPIAPPAGTPSPEVTGSPTSAATESPTAEATSSPAYGTTATPTATAGARNGQATADEAAQTFARAFGTGDAGSVCAVMATDTSPVASNQTDLERCTSVIGGLIDLVKDQVSDLQNATVSGATVSGSTATFTNATITPELAKKLLEGRTAVRIEDKWYINS